MDTGEEKTPMRTWTAKVRLSNGALQEVRIQADSYFNAVATTASSLGREQSSKRAG
jgi:hypothetical protein